MINADPAKTDLVQTETLDNGTIMTQLAEFLAEA